MCDYAYACLNFMAILNRMKLLNFRNISKIQLDFGRGINIFVGENGQGKTNIIESIYFLTKGQSFRPGKNENFIKKGDDRASLIAIIEEKGRKDEVVLKFLDDKKNFEVNKKKTTPIKISKCYSNVLFSPESLSAIKDGPEQRRQLVDEFLISHQPANSSILSDYKKCLLSRNRILKNFKQGGISEGECSDLLESLNPVFLKLSTDLTLNRVKSLNEISPFFVQSFRRITNLEKVDIFIDYLVSSQPARDWKREEIYDAMRKRLSQLQLSELAAGLTLVGPHRHDVKFLYQKEDSRYFCSQGQQRVLILSFKMAQILYHYSVYGEHPILLLDDVLSELDHCRRKNLMEFLRGVTSQIFITTTDANQFEVFGNNVKTFKVKSGEVALNI